MNQKTLESYGVALGICLTSLSLELGIYIEHLFIPNSALSFNFKERNTSLDLKRAKGWGMSACDPG